MGLWSWLFGSRFSGSPIADIKGSGNFALDVVGESHYQCALGRICGGKTHDGHELETMAVLIHEDNNPHDKNAVRVEIDNQTIGYLSRKDAPKFREALAKIGYPRYRASCKALIVGGWDRGKGDTGHFGVKLDIPLNE